MSRKSNGLAAVVWVLLGLAAVSARAPQPPSGTSGPAAPSYPGPVPPGAIPPPGLVPPPGGGQPAGPVPVPVGLSRWIVGTDPDCCGPLSHGNPMRTELFIRSGVALPGGDGQLADSLQTGWSIAGGGRALFFNDLGDAAWTLEANIINIYNHSDSNPPPIRLLNLEFNDPNLGTRTIPAATVTVRSLTRTYVSLGFGREWYLLGAAAGTRGTPHPAAWRFGIDGGGRWGSAKLNFNEIQHRNDVIGATYLAAHTDLDFPWGCCTFQAGFRAEWDYTWSNILQVQNKSDVETVNLLFNFGVRY